jgi:hypothetical protein
LEDSDLRLVRAHSEAAEFTREDPIETARLARLIDDQRSFE